MRAALEKSLRKHPTLLRYTGRNLVGPTRTLKRCSGAMDNITDVEYQPLERGSKFVVPVRLNYSQNGKKKSWEAVRAGSAVACVIFNVTRKKLVCVRQFRPGVYLNNSVADGKPDGGRIDTVKNPPSIGITLELCAGIVDKPLSLEQICAEEILEETGYEVSSSSLTKIGTCRSAVGIAGEPQVLYYAEVTDDMRKGPGGGINDELIEVIELGLDEVEKLMASDSLIAPAEFFWGISWFLLNKANK